MQSDTAAAPHRPPHATSTNERVWVKFHFKTLQGIKNLTHAEALELRGQDPDWAQRDLVEAIDRGDYPQWALKIQIITDAQAQSFAWNPFDLTRSGRIASSRSSTSVL